MGFPRQEYWSGLPGPSPASVSISPQILGVLSQTWSPTLSPLAGIETLPAVETPPHPGMHAPPTYQEAPPLPAAEAPSFSGMNPAPFSQLSSWLSSLVLLLHCGLRSARWGSALRREPRLAPSHGLGRSQTFLLSLRGLRGGAISA